MSLTPYSKLGWKDSDSPINPATPSDPYLNAATLNAKEQQFKDVVDAVIALQTAIEQLSGYTNEQAQDAIASLISAGNHVGISFNYDDANNKLSANVSVPSWNDLTDKPIIPSISGLATQSSVDAKVDKPVAGDDLESQFTSFAASLVNTETYVEPNTSEINAAIKGLHLMIMGLDATSILSPLGFTITTGVEAVSKKPYILAKSEYSGGNRKWGWFLVDPSRSPRMLVTAPHPKWDANTETFALDTWRRVSGAILVMAGAHRQSPLGSAPVEDPNQGLADPTHSPGSMLNQVTSPFSAYGLPHLQWHGFGDSAAPGLDAVISPASTVAGPTIKRFADDAEAAGVVVGREWDGTATVLLSRDNEQAKIANINGSIFIHCEMSNTVRVQPGGAAKKQALKNAAVSANIPDMAATASPRLANAVTGQFPQENTITSNVTGTSSYVARADHRHRQTLDGPQPRDAGMLGWSIVPVTATGSVQTTAGVLYISELRLRAGTINQLWLRVSTAGATLTSGQCLMGILDSSGNLLGQTTSQHTAWQSTGLKNMSVITPFTITQDIYYSVILTNGTTQPQFKASSSTGDPNGFRLSAPYSVGTSGTGLTSLPSSVVLSGMSAVSQQLLTAASI